MGWIERCYQTYEKNLAQVGKPSASIRHGWNAPILLPVAHTTQKVKLAYLKKRTLSQHMFFTLMT